MPSRLREPNNHRLVQPGLPREPWWHGLAKAHFEYASDTFTIAELANFVFGSPILYHEIKHTKVPICRLQYSKLKKRNVFLHESAWITTGWRVAESIQKYQGPMYIDLHKMPHVHQTNIFIQNWIILYICNIAAICGGCQVFSIWTNDVQSSRRLTRK